MVFVECIDVVCDAGLFVTCYENHNNLIINICLYILKNAISKCDHLLNHILHLISTRYRRYIVVSLKKHASYKVSYGIYVKLNGGKVVVTTFFLLL